MEKEKIEGELENSKLFAINLQLFADNEDEETEDDNESENTDNEQNNEDTDNNENEDENEDSKTNTTASANPDLVLIKTLQAQTESQNQAISELQKNIEILTSAIMGSNITQKQTTQKAKPKKQEQQSQRNTDDDLRVEILSTQIQKLQKAAKEREEMDYIREQITEKPYVKEIVDNLKISTKDEYIRYVLPMEESWKEKDELKKRLDTNSERDLISEYGYVRSQGPTKNKKQIEQAATLGGSIIDDIL